MKKIIIGTAGHIDHGKTTLIKSLTGNSTDTLKEEIKRGISINLGFTYFDLPSGTRAGIIDVPGHERFIKNMIAGSTGVDIVLLVISATEGIMPQTMEHIEILNHLEIKDALIVITKSSLVDTEYLELLKDEITDELKNTFFNNKNIICVDSVTKYGVDNLVSSIDTLTKTTKERNKNLPTRLNIDRAFTINGFGTVVTGTLSEGSISVGDELMMYPNNKLTKIKSIQVHEEDVDTAFAGQRTALNLHNIKIDEVHRGHILAKEGTLVETSIADVKITVASSCKEIKMWDRVRVYTGTKEILARVVPINCNSFLSSETGYCQLRFETPCFLKKNDLFVLRKFSPLETIAGGTILLPNASRHKNISENEFNILKTLESNDLCTVVENFIKNNDSNNLSVGKISTSISKSIDDVSSTVKEIVGVSIINLLDIYIHFDTYNLYIEKIISIVSDYHDTFPLRLGISKSELFKKVNPSFKLKYFDMLLQLTSDENVINFSNNLISIKTFKPIYTKKELEIKNLIENTLLNNKFTPPKINDFITTDKNINLDEIINSITNDSIICLDKSTYIHKKFYLDAINILKDLNNSKGNITLGDFRTATNSSRKFSLLLLELFDNNKITRRVDDFRILI